MAARVPGATRARGGAVRDRAFDEAVGAKIRALRSGRGMSQTALGRAVGVSFQQVQKYEGGRDRVAASTLATLSRALGVEPAVFFAEVEAPADGSVRSVGATMALAASVGRIGDRRVARSIEELVAEVARACGGDGARGGAPGE